MMRYLNCITKIHSCYKNDHRQQHYFVYYNLHIFRVK